MLDLREREDEGERKASDGRNGSGVSDDMMLRNIRFFDASYNFDSICYNVISRLKRGNCSYLVTIAYSYLQKERKRVRKKKIYIYTLVTQKEIF